MKIAFNDNYSLLTKVLQLSDKKAQRKKELANAVAGGKTKYVTLLIRECFKSRSELQIMQVA